MDMNPELARLLSGSGGELRKIGSKWLVTNGAKVCVGETPDAAVEAFLTARQPRKRDVIDRLTVIDTVVREPATPPDNSRIDALEESLAQTDAALRFLLEPVDFAPFPDPMPIELEKMLRSKAPAPEPHNFPENMSDKLVDWVEPAGEDLQQLMAGEETLAAAVERMTPGLDELLDMASALSEASFEQAIVTIPVEKRNTWTERLFDERARLRLKRNTDEENLDRENLISRVATVFTKVGSKR